MAQLDEGVVPLSGALVGLVGVWQTDVEAYHWYYEVVCDHAAGDGHLNCECPVGLRHD